MLFVCGGFFFTHTSPPPPPRINFFCSRHFVLSFPLSSSTLFIPFPFSFFIFYLFIFFIILLLTKKIISRVYVRGNFFTHTHVHIYIFFFFLIRSFLLSFFLYLRVQRFIRFWVFCFLFCFVFFNGEKISLVFFVCEGIFFHIRVHTHFSSFPFTSLSSLEWFSAVAISFFHWFDGSSTVDPSSRAPMWE